MKAKKVISFCLSAAIACGSALTLTNNSYSQNLTNPIVASAAISNYIGDGLSWTYDSSSRTLTISGTGEMKDFNGINSVPWRGQAYGAKKVILSDGLKSIGNYAFAMFSDLKYIEIPNSVQKIGKYVFYNSGLEAVELNATPRTIHESAFKNTPYYRNKFTTIDAPYMNIGSAENMTGRQLVVNIFPAELRGVNGSSEEVTSSYHVNHNSEYVLFENYHLYKYKKSDFRYTFNSKWGYKNSLKYGSNIKASNGETPLAVSLDSINYAGLVSSNSTKFKKNATTANIKGQYVYSPSMKSTLDTVQSALDYLEEYAAEYGQDLEFVMTPDTNYYFTFDGWDDTVEYNYSIFGNPVAVEPIVGSLAKIHEWGSANSLFEQMYSKAGFNIMMTKNQIDNNDFTSALTKQLKAQYGVNGVVYIVHGSQGNDFNGITFPTNSIETKRKVNCLESKQVPDEYCMIKSGTKFTIMHEICHLYGAKDYYNTNKNSLGGSANFATCESNLVYTLTYYKGDNADIMSGTIMNSNLNAPKIGADTAFSIGWSDNILKDTFEVLFNEKNYPFGDVNMDGVVDTRDSYCLRYYTLYKESGNTCDNTSVSLTPVQKALGNVTPF